MLGPALTFLLVASAYALGLCPTVYWLDSGELAGASFELGIAHAPGQPLALLVGKLFTFLPLGDVSLRVGLAQAFCGAGAGAVVAWLGERLARRFTQRGVVAIGVGAGLLYAASYAAAFAAIRAEVYALSALLVLSAFAMCVRWSEERDPRHLGIAGLLFGLGLTNHHYLVLLGAVPPALVLLWSRDRGLARGLALGAIGTTLGLLVYVYLPLRSAHDPIIDWGHPRDLASFYWVVSAQSFQKSIDVENQRDVPLLMGAILDQLGPVFSLLAIGGLYLCLRRAPRMGLALLLLFLGPVGARLLVAFDPGNPDAFGYLSTGIAALALLCVPLVAALVALAPKLAWLVPVVSALHGMRTMPSLATFDDVHATFAPVVAQIPTGALAVPSYYQTTFTLDYLRVVEGVRPDVSFLPRHFLVHPGERDALVRRDPTLAPFMNSRDLDVDAVLASVRPQWIEYDLDLDPRLVERSHVIEAHGDELQTQRLSAWMRYLGEQRLNRR